MTFQVGDIVTAKEFMIFPQLTAKIPKWMRGTVIGVVTNAAVRPLDVPKTIAEPGEVHENVFPERPFELLRDRILGDRSSAILLQVETRMTRPDHVFVTFDGSEMPSGTSGPLTVDVEEKDLELLLRPTT